MTVFVRPFLLLLALATPPALFAAPPAEQLGTLFYSPAERAAITSGREEKGGAVIPASLKLGGIVKRETGKGTVWLNNQPLNEGQSVPLASTPSITATGIHIDGKAVRVGETVNLVTGERSDILPPGAVSSGKGK